MARTVFSAVFLWALFISSHWLIAADYYRWVDQNGVVHLTDNLHNIPETQRGKAGRIESNEPPRSQPPPVAPPPSKASIPFEKQGQVVIVEDVVPGKAEILGSEWLAVRPDDPRLQFPGHDAPVRRNAAVLLRRDFGRQHGTKRAIRTQVSIE